MAHWFDLLAQPHTRRTTLRAAGLGAAALALPNLRLPQARATTAEPCYQPCVAAAGKAWNDQEPNCALLGTRGVTQLLISGSVINLWLGALGRWDCDSRAELKWHRAVEACRGSECGDRSKYPGGQAPKPPPPKCTVGEEVVCGDRCCSVIAECCACTSDPSGYCCCAAGKCGPNGCF